MKRLLLIRGSGGAIGAQPPPESVKSMVSREGGGGGFRPQRVLSEPPPWINPCLRP